MAMTKVDFELRRLESLEEYRACVALQQSTWGIDFLDVVPSTILNVSQRIGGVTAGAFDVAGRLLGFVFGMTGVEEGRIVHWSDMLAVVPEMRGRGLGAKLKWYQRELLLPIGVETVYWTFDPLESRNANLNLNHLGAQVHEYVENMYGETSSDLHAGLGTDRFIVAWSIASEIVESTSRGERVAPAASWEALPIVNTLSLAKGIAEPHENAQPEGEAFRVEIPANIQAEKTESASRGREWRISTRNAILRGIASGYTVRAFTRDEAGRCFYVLQKS